ncbi:MAG: hypothetical protein IPH59_10480 [bacterium]|nr:hypothetical protein [bacterium]
METTWLTIGALLTVFTFSFLYKDNPFYKFAEHLVVGVSAGYFVVLLIRTNLVPIISQKMFVADRGWELDQWWYIIPLILGVMMWARFSKKLSWISRYPLALYIGVASALTIPLELKNRVVEQLQATVLKFKFDMSNPDFLGVPQGVWDIVVVIGVISCLIYFFFSKEHKGWFGGSAKVGIYTLMIAFGASFGYTVMARISLFIQRIQYLRDWISAISS